MTRQDTKGNEWQVDLLTHRLCGRAVATKKKPLHPETGRVAIVCTHNTLRVPPPTLGPPKTRDAQVATQASSPLDGAGGMSRGRGRGESGKGRR